MKSVASRIDRDPKDWEQGRYWPPADHFALVALDGAARCLTGESRIVRRLCVLAAARLVSDCLDDVGATGSCRGALPYLDLVGDSASADGRYSLVMLRPP